ncbi:MAG TPA: acyl carrier protein [Rhodanobacteraceae bacterium]|nr:acyl carrier protein [Rhodanobacteraceae bacterium]
MNQLQYNPFSKTYIGDSHMSSVQETIFAIISKEAGIDLGKISLDSTLKELEIQSLDAVQIIFEIEDHYKITLPDRDPNFDTESVKGLVEAVEKLVAEKQSAAAASA